MGPVFERQVLARLFQRVHQLHRASALCLAGRDAEWAVSPRTRLDRDQPRPARPPNGHSLPTCANNATSTSVKSPPGRSCLAPEQILGRPGQMRSPLQLLALHDFFTASAAVTFACPELWLRRGPAPLDRVSWYATPASRDWGIPRFRSGEAPVSLIPSRLNAVGILRPLSTASRSLMMSPGRLCVSCSCKPISPS